MAEVNREVIERIRRMEAALDAVQQAMRRPGADDDPEVRQLLRQQGIEPYILSTEACAICDRCAILDGQPCRMPGRMHPCVESHGINLIPTLEENGLEFQYGDNIVTWYSLLFFNE